MVRKGVGADARGTKMNAAIGIDVSKARLDCALVELGRDKPRWEKQVARTPAGVAQLLAKTPAGVPWVMEPTGRYSQEVALLAAEHGQQVLLALTKPARQVLNGLSHASGRTDRTDGIGLGRYALFAHLRDYPLKSEVMDELDQAISARASLAAALSRLRAQQRDLPRAARRYDRAIAALESELEELDRELAGRVRSEPDLATARELDRVPGIGAVVALAVANRLEEKQFDHPDQFVAYCGWHLTFKDSGQKQGRRKLSKHGDGELRRLLYLAAMANLHCKESPFKDQYHRELAKPGMTTTGALCAVARNLARVCWSIHRHGTSYDPQRVNRQPGSGPPAAEKGGTAS
jgi:transposase